MFQAEDGIRDLVRSRGLGDVYKRQSQCSLENGNAPQLPALSEHEEADVSAFLHEMLQICLLYTSDAADERSSVDLGGRRIIKKKTYRDIRVKHPKSKRVNTECEALISKERMKAKKHKSIEV